MTRPRALAVLLPCTLLVGVCMVSCADDDEQVIVLDADCSDEGEILGHDGACKCQDGYVGDPDVGGCSLAPSQPAETTTGTGTGAGADCGCRNPGNDDPSLPACEGVCEERSILWQDHCGLTNFVTECDADELCKYLWETGEPYCGPA